MMRYLLSTIFILLIPLWAEAAILYLEPSDGEYYQNDTFIVEIRIDAENECINTVRADLSFPKDFMRAVDFSQGNSILTIWVKAPEVDQDSGVVSFTGGIPGGYCGILPGDSGKSNLLGKIIFEIKNIGSRQEAEIRFLAASQVLLHDGAGTLAELSFRNGVFALLSGIPESLKQEWQEELGEDTIPPEPFEIRVNQDSFVFEGKYFITFNTTDKQSGIDYYRVKEEKGDWQEAVSPYVLKNQNPEGIIKVRAVDKAGNERVAKYGSEISSSFIWIIVAVMILIILIWPAVKKLWKLRTQNKTS